MHRNPVKRGLADAPEQWRWSSHRFYLLNEPGQVKINEGWRQIFFRKNVAESSQQNGSPTAASYPPFANPAKEGAPSVVAVQAIQKTGSRRPELIEEFHYVESSDSQRYSVLHHV
jgi:hypothetical protein